MSDGTKQVGHRAVAAIPGWLLLIGGLALVAMAFLTPSWLELRELAWERDLMVMQAERLQVQAERYKQFEQALVENDPVLLERLAMTQLRMLPADRDLLRLSVPGGGIQGGSAHSTPVVLEGPRLQAAVDAWLAEPMPRVGYDVDPLEPIGTRLVRLVSEPRSRWAMLGAGLCFVVGGLWWGARR